LGEIATGLIETLNPDVSWFSFSELTYPGVAKPETEAASAS
jgi:hypothetical protein